MKEFFYTVSRNRRALLGMIILGFFLLLALIGPLVVPLDTTIDYSKSFQWPSLQHPLGTDYAGRDTFSQFVHGAKGVIVVSVLAAFFTILIAFLFGTLAGLLGGKVDTIITFLIDVMLTVPSFPVMMVLSLVIKITNPISFGLVLSIWSWAGLARAIRSQILSLKKRDFIEASRVLGLSIPHLIFSELLPNLVSYIMINFIMTIREAITASVGLIILGLAPFTSTHWGVMLQMALSTTGAMYGSSAVVYLLVPIIAIALFQMGCLFFASGLDEALNPRLRR